MMATWRTRGAVLVAAIVGTTGLSLTRSSTADAALAYSASITNGNDNLRTSWYPGQTSLTPDLVTGGTFGQLWDAALDAPTDGLGGTDSAYAQPLVYVNPNTGVSTLLVATESNVVGAVDLAGKVGESLYFSQSILFSSEITITS